MIFKYTLPVPSSYYYELSKRMIKLSLHQYTLLVFSFNVESKNEYESTKQMPFYKTINIHFKVRHRRGIQPSDSFRHNKI